MVFNKLFTVFSSPPRSSSSRSSFQPTSPPYPPSPHPELIASPNSHSELLERVAGRSNRSWSRSSSSVTASSSPFRRGVFPRPDSSLYYTASVKSGLGSGVGHPIGQQGDLDDVFGGDPDPATPSVTRHQSQISSSSAGVGVLSALLAARRKDNSSLAESQSLQRRYTEDWIRKYQTSPAPGSNSLPTSLDDKAVDLDGEDDGDDSIKGHRRNLSTTKTITPADFETPEKAKATLEEDTVTASYTSDNESGYVLYKTAPQSMAGTGSEAPPPELKKGFAQLSMENESNRPPSSNANSNTPTVTGTIQRAGTRSTTPNPYPRKALKWGKRTVFVCIPTDPRNEDGLDVIHGRPAPLTKGEVLANLRKWESLGYEFQLLERDGQSRPIYPEEVQERVNKSEIIVSIPNLDDWEAYMKQRREEKLRALGVLLDDVSPSPVAAVTTDSRGPTPMLPSNSQISWPNAFPSPLPLPAGSPMGVFNPFPNSITPHLPSPTVAGPNHGHFPFRQSISIQGGFRSPGPMEFETFPPTPQNPLNGVWSPSFNRGASPATLISPIVGHADYPVPGSPGLPGDVIPNGMHAFAERWNLHQQNIRRGSPLAHVREASIQQSLAKFHEGHSEPRAQDSIQDVHGPTIIEPIPKHQRNKPSLSLQNEMQGIEKDTRISANSDLPEEEEDRTNAFETNPTSPAPPGYGRIDKPDAVKFPDQPSLPPLEMDVHRGPELASNPEDDTTDEGETENRKQAMLGKKQDIRKSASGTDSDSRFATDLPTHPPQIIPEDNHFSYHDRSVSLQQPYKNFLPPPLPSHQIGQNYDAVDHSAMAMLVAGEGLGQGLDRMGTNDGLSEDGRTNISDDIQTNPSVPPSPKRRFSNATSLHSHKVSTSLSNNPWAFSDNPESTKSKFKFDPATAFDFTPTLFKPPTATAFGGLNGQGFTINALEFKPNHPSSQTIRPPSSDSFNFLSSKTTSFNPTVPTFTPSSYNNPPSTNPIFQQLDIVKPAPIKKIIPIVRPPSQQSKHKEEEQEEDSRGPESARKRVKEVNSTPREDDADVPALSEIKLPEEQETKEEPAEEVEHNLPERSEEEEERDRLELVNSATGNLPMMHHDVEEVSSDEAEALMEKSPIEVVTGKKDHDFNPYEFTTVTEATDFASARPSSAFERRDKVRTPETEEEREESECDISDEDSQFLVSLVPLKSASIAPSPPPKEDQPPPPPAAARRSSLFPGATEFKEFKMQSAILEKKSQPPEIKLSTQLTFDLKPTMEFKSPSEPFTPLSKPGTPTPTKRGGMGASKYAVSAASPRLPVPLSPAPPPILSPSVSRRQSPVPEPQKERPEAEDNELVYSSAEKSKPTDSELDEIVQAISNADPPLIAKKESNLAGNLKELESEHEATVQADLASEEESPLLQDAVAQEEELEEEEEEEQEEEEEEESEARVTRWKQTGSRRPGIPIFNQPLTPYSLAPPRSLQRSGAPSPTPGRVENYQHRAAELSSDNLEESSLRPSRNAYRRSNLPPVERYRSTAHGITATKDEESDWDDMIPENGNQNLRPQSRLFFDTHVEELVGDLLQSHLEPVEKSLEIIHKLLGEFQNNQSLMQLNRKASSQGAESDADDEDDEANDFNAILRSPRRDKKLEKIKSAVFEVVSMQNAKQQQHLAAIAAAVDESAHIKAALLETTKELEIKLEDNKFTIQEAMEALAAKIDDHKPNTQIEVPISAPSPPSEMVFNAVGKLEKTLKEREKIVFEATEKLVGQVNSNINNKHGAVLDAASHIADQIDGTVLDAATHLADQISEVEKKVHGFLQSSEKNIKDNILWSNRNLSESTQNLEERIIARQESAMELTRSLEEKMLDYGMVITEHAKTLEQKVLQKNDTIINNTTSLQHSFQQSQSQIIKETRAMINKLNESTRGLEHKVKDNNKTVHEATKNLENRLYERDMAMVLDARSFIEEKLKTTDRSIHDIIKDLEIKLHTRDSNVVNDAARAISDMLKERDLAVLEATKRLEAKMAEKDVNSVLEATKSLEEKFMARESAFLNATAEFERKLQERDSLIVHEINRSFGEKLEKQDAQKELESVRMEEKFMARENAFLNVTAEFERKLQERDSLIVNELNRSFGEKLENYDIQKELESVRIQLLALQEMHQKDLELAEEMTEKMLDRDLALRNATVSLEKTLKERDSYIVSETVQAVQAFEQRLLERESSDNTLEDIKTTLQELFDRQQHNYEAESPTVVDNSHAEELERKVEELEKQLKAAQSEAEEQAILRKEVQAKAVDLEVKLNVAVEEKERQRQVAEEAEKRLKALGEERDRTLTRSKLRSALLEGAHSSLQKSVSDLSARNALLEGTLQEAKASNEKIQNNFDMVQNENRELRKTIDSLRNEMEESIKVREGFRGKFNTLQEDMRNAAAEINNEHAKWKRREEEQQARIEVLEARLAAETRSKESLEREIERLQNQEREAIRLRVELEHIKRHGEKMEQLSDKLREENIQFQRKAALLEVDVESARQAARDEVLRVTAAMQRDVNNAHNEVNLIRTSLEKQVEHSRNEIDRLVHAVEAAKGKHALMLEEAAQTQKAALNQAHEEKAIAIKELKQEAVEAQTTALQEQHRKYEYQLEGLRAQHERAIFHVKQDAERDVKHLRQLLSLAKAKIGTLDEKLQVATVAAQAAAKAAQEAKTAKSEANSTAGHSSQALRETIAVLQEQLHEREAKAEELQQKLNSLEKETSKKLKDNELEINWLREVLVLRLSELEELINILQQTNFDREAIRNAAVRLKANLQMEQQVRERNNTNADGFSPAALASNLAKLPLAAAWGSWRTKGKAKSPNDEAAQSPTLPPSRPGTSQSGFLGGLLTPPSIANAGSKIGNKFASFTSPVIPEAAKGNGVGQTHRDNQSSVTSVTPRREYNTLSLRRQSYDEDADISMLGLNSASTNGTLDSGLGLGISRFGGDEFGGVEDALALEGFGDELDEEPPFKTRTYMS